MLLAIDIGNTQILLGGFQKKNLLFHARLRTDPLRTSDEYGVALLQLLDTYNIKKGRIKDVILACVVPPLLHTITKTLKDYLGLPPLRVGPDLAAALTRGDTWVEGAFALEQGFIFTAMMWAATTVAIIEGRYRLAGVWMLAGAALAWTGLVHGWQWTPADTVLKLGIGAGGQVALAYTICGAVFLLAPVLGTRDEAAGGH